LVIHPGKENILAKEIEDRMNPGYRQ